MCLLSTIPSDGIAPRAPFRRTAGRSRGSRSAVPGCQGARAYHAAEAVLHRGVVEGPAPDGDDGLQAGTLLFESSELRVQRHLVTGRERISEHVWVCVGGLYLRLRCGGEGIGRTGRQDDRTRRSSAKTDCRVYLPLQWQSQSTAESSTIATIDAFQKRCREGHRTQSPLVCVLALASQCIGCLAPQLIG